MGTPEHVLGRDDGEIARLQVQAAALAEPTALLLKRAGIVAVMKVLDIGTGPGDVAFQLAELVGAGTGHRREWCRHRGRLGPGQPRAAGRRRDRRRGRGVDDADRRGLLGASRVSSGDEP